MKILCKLQLCTESGDYKITFENLSSPGDSIDFSKISPLLEKVLKDFESKQVEKLIKTLD